MAWQSTVTSAGTPFTVDGNGEKVIGRVVGKGLAGDEMSERVYLVIDGIDARVHHIEF